MSVHRSGTLGLALAATTVLTLATPVEAEIVTEPVVDRAADATLSLAPIGSYDAGVFNESAAEIVAYHAASQRLLTVNANAGVIDELDASDPTNPKKIGEISGGEGTTINSVAVRPDGLAVAAVEPSDKTATGELIFFDAGADELSAEPLGRVSVGSLPDMVTMTPDGTHALVANEGEPAPDYTRDPEGSIAIITLRDGIEPSSQADVRTAGFGAFNAQGALPNGVHIFGQVGASTTVAQNLEPEYITVSDNKAYVSLQENNAIAVVDIASATVERIFPLGYQDGAVIPFDASNKDAGINLRPWPIKGIKQPDAVASYSAGGQTFIVTANEGDARDWDAYSEEARLGDFGTDGIAPVCEGFAGLDEKDRAAMLSPEGAGRLNLTTAYGKNAEGTCYEELYSYGGRSFSIIAADGTQVFDSADQFEQITARVIPEYFNSNHEEAKFDNRSDDKGPEPEGLTLGTVDGRTYAFIGFERVGGIIVYDITDPHHAKYETYINNRDFGTNTGDLGPEGLTFIPASASPNAKNLLAVGNEVSGSTTIYQIDSLAAPGDRTPGSSAGSSGSSASSSQLSSSPGGVALVVLAALLTAFGALAAAIGSGILPNPLPDLLANLPF